MRWWKILGLAGVAGVAATGVVIARAERRRQAYTPDEIRTRLRARLEEASAREASGVAAAGGALPGGGAAGSAAPGGEAPGQAP
ncbi:hypothetical protein GCM10010517_35610 [Streptosporangium fragile]|uniref:Secreted protein n=1 Tax=Streptosporangium fragile TaxID=46186 RepID=A0ABP6IE97_9ACTN